MAIKSKTKSKVKPKAAMTARARVKSKTVKVKKLKAKAVARKTARPVAKAASPVRKISAHAKDNVRATASPSPAIKPTPTIVKRVVTQTVERRRPVQRTARVNQFSFMKAPGHEHVYEVGGSVEVFCDHEKNRERIRGWVKGIVVQVDNKMVAVQFRSNVFLTDGWMVPDRILWFPLNSEHMRPVPGKKSQVKDFIPEY